VIIGFVWIEKDETTEALICRHTVAIRLKNVASDKPVWASAPPYQP
jgi:hypothetical protein